MNDSSDSSSGSGSTTSDAEIALSILVMMILLGLTAVVAYLLQKFKVKYVHETFVAIVMGAIAGLIIHYTNAGDDKDYSFNADLFYFLLLPPIIFNSGYDLNRRHFFRNFVGILSFAFAGTVIATLVTGFLLYAFIAAGLDAGGMQLVDCLVFGALISATDPVTVLAIFHAMHVDPKIFALVFGESIMNDAVAIALYESVIGFKEGTVVNAASIFTVLGSFLGIFFGSFAIGTLTGCVSALVFKHTGLYKYPGLEATVFVVFAYGSFMLAQAVGASGIVSMLFCGIAMAHYAFFNMSVKTQQTTKYMFHLLSFMAENMVFSYVGMSIFTSPSLVYKPAFIVVTFFVILLARVFNVVPISFVLNKLKRDPKDHLTVPHQTILWWSGLRGALAFMLATRVEGPSGPIILSTTLVMVVATVALFGSSTRFMLEYLQIPIGVPEEPAHSTQHDDTVMTNWFGRINKKYIEPFLKSPMKNHDEFGGPESPLPVPAHALLPTEDSADGRVRLEQFPDSEVLDVSDGDGPLISKPAEPVPAFRPAMPRRGTTAQNMSEFMLETEVRTNVWQ